MGSRTDEPLESTTLQAPLLDIHAVATALGSPPARSAPGRRAEDPVPEGWPVRPLRPRCPRRMAGSAACRGQAPILMPEQPAASLTAARWPGVVRSGDSVGVRLPDSRICDLREMKQ